MNNDFVKAKNYAFRLLKVRFRSCKEIETKLALKGFSSDIIKKNLELLTELGYIDDLKFAKLWIESRLRFNPKGKYALIQELKQKGLDPWIIEQSIALINENTEYRLAMQVARKRLVILGSLPVNVIRRRLGSYLGRRGFKSSLIFKIIKELICDEN
ncbi:MAG: regulatory protein RecX [Candidatus Omnitrophica bacterium]|nr:regulatory protein RecX [Candidatus Omnitrophota bacterium]